MKLAKIISMVATALFAVALTAGCDRSDRSAERVGEKAGSKIDQATAQVKEQASNVGDKMDDATITAKVKTALIGEPDLEALKIDVDTADGVVTLSGTVDSRTKVSRAVQVAQAVQGVRSVDNRLTVKQG
ncbi:MAG TPA: BON domain-containing protein [Burkholderiales bacterium]|nr:BON domain-containing protein [Burkholderiales bacterium]